MITNLAEALIVATEHREVARAAWVALRINTSEWLRADYPVEPPEWWYTVYPHLASEIVVKEG